MGNGCNAQGENGEMWGWVLNNDKIMEGRDGFMKRFRKGEGSAAVLETLEENFNKKTFLGAEPTASPSLGV